MEKSGSRRSDKERKAKRLDDEVVERICPLCDGRGYYTSTFGGEAWPCERCEGLGVVYAEE